MLLDGNLRSGQPLLKAFPPGVHRRVSGRVHGSEPLTSALGPLQLPPRQGPQLVSGQGWLWDRVRTRPSCSKHLALLPPCSDVAQKSALLGPSLGCYPITCGCPLNVNFR